MSLVKKCQFCGALLEEFEDIIPINRIHKNYTYTLNKIEILKEELNKILKKNKTNFFIILMGSFGRFESSKLSDLDYCIVYDRDIKKSKKRKSTKLIESKFKEILDIKTSCFSQKPYKEILSNIGGFNDKSIDFTTRILILLESIPLNNEGLYEKLINDLSEQYLEEFIREKKYPLFLTNEIIRFWRTLCIDYRWKKIEGEKPWGLRNIKLRFSRKLLCFSSLILLILLNNNIIDLQEFINYVHCPPSIKLMAVYKLVMNNELTNDDEKVIKIIEKILITYNEFLESISSEDIRKSLEDIEFESRDSNSNYKYLKNKAKELHDNLISLIEIIDIEILKKYLIF